MRFGREMATPASLVIEPENRLPVAELEPVVLLPLAGRVFSGTDGIANARLQIVGAGGASIDVTSDESGSFSLDLPPGALTLTVVAEGFEPGEQQIVLGEDTAALEIYLDAILPPGQLRGLVRSFRGKPLRAELRIEPERKVVETGKDGSFEIDLPPGAYEVTISVEGFTSQTRQILIEEEGVTIMNVDLRR